MAFPKREKPLTDDERKARNRLYQHNRRHRTNNSYPRAYRRAGQRAIKWFQENREGTWHRWLNEELACDEDTPYQPLRNPVTGAIRCLHDGKKHIIGFTVGCDICGKAVGSVTIGKSDREHLNEEYDV